MFNLVGPPPIVIYLDEASETRRPPLGAVSSLKVQSLCLNLRLLCLWMSHGSSFVTLDSYTNGLSPT